jgi:peroxiredoxin Q/BCP
MSSILKTLAAIGTGLFTANAANAAEPLAIGAKIPAVSQKNQDGVTISLADAGASAWLLVYFYPKADTPGCTKQACSLRDAFATLTEKGVKVFGVSNDSPNSQKAFKTKYQLPFDLLADEDSTIVKAFGVPTTMGFAKRQAYLFKDGALVWFDHSASTDQQAADVLKFIETKN